MFLNKVNLKYNKLILYTKNEVVNCVKISSLKN